MLLLKKKCCPLPHYLKWIKLPLKAQEKKYDLWDQVQDVIPKTYNLGLFSP